MRPWRHRASREAVLRSQAQILRSDVLLLGDVRDRRACDLYEVGRREPERLVVRAGLDHDPWGQCINSARRDLVIRRRR
jgi:hypothetical protein